MRKYLPLVFAACTYAAGAAAADPSANVDPVKQTRPPANADAKGDANVGAPTASDNARPEKRSSDAAGAGATQDSSQKPAKSKKPAKRELKRD